MGASRQSARRWLAFNGVGILGFVVQLTVLTGLIRGLGVHYLLAAVIAVEAAILHNFLWHQRYTWRDRPSAGADGSTTRRRLIRFHLLNGTVSLAGNAVVMLLLTGAFGLDPIRANVVAVLSCSIVNFFGSEMLVFRTTAVALALILTPVAVGHPYAADSYVAAELQARTLAAWEVYQRQVDGRFRHDAMFAHDAFGRDKQWRDVARSGAIAMFESDRPLPGGQTVDVPDGTIHHWIGAVFIPGVTLNDVLKDLKQNAGKESQSYEDVIASRLIDRSGDRVRVYLKLRRESAFVTVHYNTEHEVEYRVIDATHAASRSTATKITELANAGTPTEREKKPGEDYGFLWRLNAYWRYEQVAGGVLIECESISLSRGIPFALRLFVTRSVKGIARESLEKTLRGLRATLATS
jgi:putative flippase GtrA